MEDEIDGLESNLAVGDQLSHTEPALDTSLVTCKRFEPTLNEQELTALSQATIPANTRKSTEWARSIFFARGWMKTTEKREISCTAPVIS